jgi:aspartate/methionine/tyrosine aminotransferase
VLYLRWVKEMNQRLAGRRNVINLAGSAFQLPEAAQWLDEELSKRGASLVAAKKSVGNDFGLPELKDAIRAAFQVPAEREILLTSGASGAIRFSLQLLLEGSGPRHLVVEQPVYEPLISIARRMGATVAMTRRDRTVNFVDEVARRLTRETIAVVLTNPHNPTGDLLAPDELRALAEAVASRTSDGVVIVDETFADLSSLSGWSAGNLDRRIVTISGLTKCYGLGSLRSGWLTVDRRRFPEAVDAWVDFENIGSPWLELLAARAIGQFNEWRPALAKRIVGARQTTSRWLESVVQEGLFAPDAIGESCVVFPRWLGETPPLELVERLVADYRVVVAPGEFFYPPAGQAIRIGYGGDQAELAEGLERLATGLRALA